LRGIRITWVSSFAVLAMLLAGCGGGDEDNKPDDAKFKTAALVTTNQISQIGQDLGATLRRARRSSDAALAKQFSGLASRTRASVAKLKALHPPDSARQEVAALTAALSTGADDLAAITSAVRTSDAKAAGAATKTLVGDHSPPIKKANDALKAELRRPD
jgi:hypothetical protein